MNRSRPLLASLSRRAMIAASAGATLAASLPVTLRAADRAALFRHGVASGDPDASSVVLWTRVSGQAGRVEGEWQIASDPAFTHMLRTGTFATDADRDHTVKVLAEGLEPGKSYWFRFICQGAVSPSGRTRTLPQGRLDKLGIALASCSNYAFGFFNAYNAIARDPHVDFVLHTGDYIYEYGADGWGGDVARKIGRVHAPANEIVSLSDYRTRHAQYKTDAGSLAMLAAHPLLCCWDDHESANNPWVDGAENHQPDKEGDWATRRAASIQAYYEWMPIREPAPGCTRMQFWRSYSFGDLATLVTLETRHTARAKQIDYRDLAPNIKTLADARRLEHETIDAPDRRLLAPELEADLEAALTRSVNRGQPWRVIGNPMIIARTRVPDVVAQGIIPDPFAKDDDKLNEARVLAWKGKWNMPFYPDTWDGYEWARERLYALSRRAGAGDLIFLSGDSHSFWANQLADASGRPAGVELGTAGITSPGDFIDSGFARDVAARLDAALARHNPEILWTDNLHQGFVRLDLGRTRGQATFVAVDSVLIPGAGAHILKRFDILRQGRNVTLAPAQGKPRR